MTKKRRGKETFFNVSKKIDLLEIKLYLAETPFYNFLTWVSFFYYIILHEFSEGNKKYLSVIEFFYWYKKNLKQIHFSFNPLN